MWLCGLLRASRARTPAGTGSLWGRRGGRASAGWNGIGGVGGGGEGGPGLLSPFLTLLPSPGSSGQGGCLVSELQEGLLLLLFSTLSFQR